MQQIAGISAPQLRFSSLEDTISNAFLRAEL
jgi:hypothetical protein